MGCVAGDPTSRGARPGGLPRTARHGARLCAVPQAGPVRFGTGPGSAVSMFHGPPKPHDARSASPDIALRTPPRPGRAPHELVRAARASHSIAGFGLRRGSQHRPARETEAQVARGSDYETNPRAAGEFQNPAPSMGGLSRSPRQARRQPNLVTPGRSGRRGGEFSSAMGRARPAGWPASIAGRSPEREY